MTGIRLLVVEAWHPADRKPLILKEGDHVKVGHHDTEWTAYRWCTGDDGTSGWVPLDYLVIDEYGGGTVTVDYRLVRLELIDRSDENPADLRWVWLPVVAGTAVGIGLGVIGYRRAS